MSVLDLKVPPPVVTLAVALAMRAVAAQATGSHQPLGTHTAVAFVLAAAGFLIEVAGALSFARARTSLNPMRPRSTSTLVVTGVYRFTRNPIYLGDLLILVAWAIFLLSLQALLLTSLFVLYINRFQITPEERVLSSGFGADYAAYRTRVRRWL